MGRASGVNFRDKTEEVGLTISGDLLASCSFRACLVKETVEWVRTFIEKAPKYLEDYRTGIYFLYLLKETLGEDAMENGL